MSVSIRSFQGFARCRPFFLIKDKLKVSKLRCKCSRFSTWQANPAAVRDTNTLVKMQHSKLCKRHQ